MSDQSRTTPHGDEATEAKVEAALAMIAAGNAPALVLAQQGLDERDFAKVALGMIESYRNNAQASPVSVPNKGRWPWALFYNGYWFVKKSHAERAITCGRCDKIVTGPCANPTCPLAPRSESVQTIAPCQKCGQTPPFPGGTRCQDLQCPLINWAVGPTLTQRLRALYLCTENVADAETLKEAIAALSTPPAELSSRLAERVTEFVRRAINDRWMKDFGPVWGERQEAMYADVREAISNALASSPPSAREPGIRPAAFVGVMNALVRSCCYACGWPLGSCKPFDCGMRYSDGSEHLVEKKNWLKRAEDMAEVWKWIVAMQDAPVGPGGER